MGLHNMMKKRYMALILALILLSALLLPTAHAASTPLLYRVTDEQGHVIYLFGTIHVGNEGLYPLPDAVLEAFDESDMLAVELDLIYEQEHPEELLRYAMDVYYTDGTQASDVLGADTVELAAGALNMDKRLLSAMKPHGILSLLEEKSVQDALLDANLGVDLFLLRRAREMSKEIVPLETVAQQFSLIHGMSDRIAAYQIRMYALYPQQAALATLMLLNAWKTGDLAAMRKMLEADSDVSMLPEELAEEILAYNRQMYADRDRAFTKRAQTFLENGDKVFFAVGAAHVAGENGIADQLEQLGYTVEKIQP